MDPNYLIAGLPLLAGWIWWVDKKVASHEAIIQKVDKLVDMLLQERLAAHGPHS